MSGSAPTEPLGTDHALRHRLLVVAMLALAIAVGALASLQAHYTGEMAQLLGDPRQAAVISFATGLALLALIVVSRQPLRAGLGEGLRALRGGRLRRWQLLGGLGGATFVFGQSVVVPRVGVALFTVSVVGAQTANSLLVDYLGLGPRGHQAVTATRVLAAVIAVGAVVISVWGKEGTFALGPLVLAVAAGAATAVQFAINGRVAVATGQPLDAALVNFVVGLSALLVLYAGGLVVLGHGPNALPRGHWWLYLAGPIGVVFIAVAAWSVRVLGVLLFSLGAVAGQLAGAVGIDLWTNRPVGAATWLGVVLTLGAVVVGSGLLRRRAPA